jgi:predicted GNAT family acetyltransferase
MNTQITRSAGIATGIGYYMVGNGYKGSTKELDDKVVEIADRLTKLYGKNVEIRFNSDRESGGGFIKDDNFSCKIGVGARLASSEFISLTREEKIAFPMENYDKLPKDLILYHVVLDESIRKTGVGTDDDFNSIEEALEFLKENTDLLALQEYLSKI